MPVWWISTQSCPQFLPFQLTQKEFELLSLYSGISKQIKALQPFGQATEFKFESNFEPLPVIWQSLRRLFQKTIKGFDCKITGNGQALGAALWHSLGG